MAAKTLLFHGEARAKLLARTGLQNAASIAGLALTTDCMIARLPARNGAPAPKTEPRLLS